MEKIKSINKINQYSASDNTSNSVTIRLMPYRNVTAVLATKRVVPVRRILD